MEVPGGDGNLLLQLGQLERFVPFPGSPALLLFLVLAVLRLSFAEDFLERPNLAKIHVARGASKLPVWPDIVGPKEIGQQLVRLQ